MSNEVTVKGLRDYIIIFIILLIGFQAFPIIKIGGTFKVYELFAIVLLIVELLYIKTLKLAGNIALIAFCFFIVSPIISYLYSNLFLGYPHGFYHQYPDASTFKFNFYVFPALVLIYMFFNFFVFNRVVISRYIYQNFEAILKYSVIIGTLISVYSLLAMFFGDVVLKLPSFIQNKSEFNYRSYGFSQEPSFYVLYQGWICLFAWYTKRLFNKKIWYFIILLNAASLVLSLSTNIASFFVVVLCSVFLLRNSFKRRLWALITVAAAVLAGYLVILYFDLFDLFNYVFTAKITSFTAPEFSYSSGGIRRYTSELGIRIFKDHWLTGVGVGDSIYYMYVYDYLKLDDIVVAGTFPQNAFSCVLSEQGIIGGGLFLALLLSIVRKFWVYRNESKYNQMFLSGTLFNIACLLSIVPVYAIYMWIFIALGLNYIKNFNSVIG